MFEMPGMPGASMGAISLGDMFGKAFGGRTKSRRTTVSEAYEPLVAEESDKLLDQESLTEEAIREVENNGIVFLDEIDKIAGRGGQTHGPDVSREGVQRDILPIVEGSNVTTKYGTVRTDHVLFIAAGAFHTAKVSDLIPELQGRFPIRVELDSLRQEDFARILREPKNSLIRQYQALLRTEGVEVTFTDPAIDELAAICQQVNADSENIGARRLHTIMEYLLEDISFDAPDKPGTTLEITDDEVRRRLAGIAEKQDLTQFIL
jgi:ATP-dependent HslUV protease ATP-binding subunit HslU